MKKLLLLIVLLLFVSCTTTSVKQDSISYTKDEIIEIGINAVEKEYNIIIERKDVSLMKVGYGLWKLVLYGMTNPIFVEIDESGVVQKIEMRDYIY